MTVPVRPTTILTRASLATPESGISSLQSQVDGLVSRFVEEAASPTTLAAITAGGFAYRVGRLSVLSSVGASGGTPVRLASLAFGLGSEVTAFEFTNRSFAQLRAIGRSPLQQNPNLWNWSGPGGWRDGIAASLVTFGALRVAGFLAREQNLVLQHLFQGSAMVSGQQVAGFIGVAPRPEGSLAEQFLHAEATNLQMSAGTALSHSLAPGLLSLERGLDLSVNLRVGTTHASPLQIHRLAMTMAEIGEFALPASGESHRRGPARNPHIHMMSAEGEGGGERKDPSSIDWRGWWRRGSIENPPVGTKIASGELSGARSRARPLFELCHPNCEVFERLSALRPFSLRSMLKGGMESLRWMNELERTLKEVIVQGDLFSELLVRDEGGNLILRLPTEMKPPSLLRLPEEYQSSPIIFLRTPFDAEIGHLAYFPIRGLVAFQGILSEKKLDDLRPLVEARQNFKTPAEIRRDSQEGFYYFDDGHHRSYLGLQAGHSHILGKIGRSYFRIRSPRFSMDQLRVLPHAEYQRIVNENEGGEGMSYTNILFKDLLEEERSHRISRILQSSDGQEHPFEIILPDLRLIQKASVGSQFPVAAREGRTLLLQVRTQDRAEYMDAFVRDGTPRTVFDLIEGEGRGQMEIFWTPNSISGYDINRLHSYHYDGRLPSSGCRHDHR